MNFSNLAHLRHFYKILIMTGFLVQSQEIFGTPGGGIVLQVGGQEVDLKKLDESLKSNDLGRVGNLDPSKSNLTTVGGSVFYYSAGILTGIEGHGFLPKNTDGTNGISTSLTGSYGMFNFGPAYSTDKGFILSPGLGIGGGRMDIKFSRTKELSEVLPADNSVEQPKIEKGNSTSISSQFAIVSTHLDILIGRSERGFAFGIRGGYVHTPPGSNWHASEGGDQLNLPEATIRGPFLRMTVGFGDF